MPESSTSETQPRFELREVWDDHTSRVEVCSLRDVAARAGDVSFSRRSFWSLSALVGGGLLAACAPAPETTPKAAVQPTAMPKPEPSATPTPRASQAPTPSAKPSRTATRPTAAAADCAGQLAHGGPAIWIALSPDGELVASAGVRVSGAAPDESALKLWRASDGSLLHTLESDSDAFMSVAFSPDGQTYATGSLEGSVSIWRASDSSLVRKLSVSSGSRSAISCLAFSPDGGLLAATTYDGQTVLWDPATGSRTRTLADATDDPLAGLAFSPDGKSLAVGAQTPGSVTFYTVADGKRAGSTAIDEIVLSLAWSPDGRRVAVGGTKKVYLLDATTRKQTSTIDLGTAEPGANSLAFDKSGARLYVGRRDGGLSVAAIGGTVKTIPAHASGSTCVALDRSAALLASTGGDGRIRLWDLTTEAQPIARCFADPAVPAVAELGIRYYVDGSDGIRRTYSVACGGARPRGSICDCNCVPGGQAASAPASAQTPVLVATTVVRAPTPASAKTTPVGTRTGGSGGVIPGGTICTCNKICTCIPVRKYCFVMWK